MRFVALALLWLIGLFTHLFYFPAEFFDNLFHHPGALLALEGLSPATVRSAWLMIFIPVLGGLIIGLMARYGSDRIRGHGIPEAIEAILIGRSRMSPKVAVLKPLSSAISIGSGGPFGAEGPIIMTGGAFGSIIAQVFHLTAAERKTLLVAGRRRRHVGHLRHARRRRAAGRRIAAVRVEAAQPDPRRPGQRRRRPAAPVPDPVPERCHLAVPDRRRTASSTCRRCCRPAGPACSPA